MLAAEGYEGRTSTHPTGVRETLGHVPMRFILLNSERESRVADGEGGSIVESKDRGPRRPSRTSVDWVARKSEEDGR